MTHSCTIVARWNWIRRSRRRICALQRRNSNSVSTTKSERAASHLGRGGLLLKGPLAARRGDAGRARDIAQALAAVDSPWATITCVEIYAILGDADRAMDVLEPAVDRRFLVPYMLRNPGVAPLKTVPRFRSMMQRIGLSV